MGEEGAQQVRETRSFSCDFEEGILLAYVWNKTRTRRIERIVMTMITGASSHKQQQQDSASMQRRGNPSQSFPFQYCVLVGGERRKHIRREGKEGNLGGGVMIASNGLLRWRGGKE